LAAVASRLLRIVATPRFSASRVISTLAASADKDAFDRVIGLRLGDRLVEALTNLDDERVYGRGAQNDLKDSGVEMRIDHAVLWSEHRRAM
jgi:hypothetical protein